MTIFCLWPIDKYDNPYSLVIIFLYHKSISSISLDKASEAGSIRFSYTNNSTESVLENSDLNSHNFNLRGVANLSDKLSVDSKATYFTQEVNNRTFGGGEGILGYVYNMPRNIAVDDLKNYQADKKVG